MLAQASLLLFAFSAVAPAAYADSPVAASSSHPAAAIKGLHPDKYDLYIPSAKNTFTCLSGGKTIPFRAVNDDYCDCEDGSDEPGTSACRNATFYCHNIGHTPGIVLSSRVGDGICDPECCDGTDEPSGVCENTCATVGAAHRARLEEERKIRKTGAKIRSSYIAFATKERLRLEKEAVELERTVSERVVEVEEARRKVEELESTQGAILEKRKASPLYTSLLTHRLALARLRTRSSRIENELNELKAIMEDLVRSYNPNYQDMAVRAAAIGYMELFHGGATPPAEGSGTGAAAGGKQPADEKAEKEAETEAKVEEEMEEEINDKELDELDKTDLMGLLVGWEDGTEDSAKTFAEDAESMIYNLAQYIPDPLLESYDFLRQGLLYWLVKLHVVDPSTKLTPVVGNSAPPTSNSNSSPARQALNAAQQSLTSAQATLRTTRETLDALSTKYGPRGEWKKLEGTCVDRALGEYNYELCWFKSATQRNLKGDGQNNLGNFAHWNRADVAAAEGTQAYYSTQMYAHGAKCWNGPHRSVKVDIACAKENSLLAVYELEKCEYVFKTTSPAACWPEDEGEDVQKTAKEPEAEMEVAVEEAAKEDMEVKDEL